MKDITPTLIILAMLGLLLLLGMDEYISQKEYCQKYAYTETKFNPGMYKIMKGFFNANITQEVNCEFFGYYENYSIRYNGS